MVKSTISKIKLKITTEYLSRYQTLPDININLKLAGSFYYDPIS